MGLLDWLKPKKTTHGPTPEGLYGGLPKGASWEGGPDPAGNPEDFIPEPDAYVFDIAEWRWDQQLCPDEGRFTARMKVVLPEKDGWAYGEFYLNINSIRKQIWVSEKPTAYRIAILSRISQLGGAT